MIIARRGLPSSRSVVGGLLVAVAALGTWWAAVGGTHPPVPTYAVATHMIGPGHQLEPADIRLVAVALPAGLHAAAFSTAGDLRGAVALGPIAAGELVQAGAVSTRTGAGRRGTELSFAVDPDWAVAGTLRVGDRIDVFATRDRGGTSRVLAGATVARLVSAGGYGLGEQRSQVLTVTVSRRASLADLVDATRAGTITVTRVTGATR